MKKLGIDQWGSTRDEGWNIRSAGEVANAYNKLIKENEKLKEDLSAMTENYEEELENRSC
tara:strand:- start:610 stop:789 length:180 start_codon:yes stop_codon:yes gene_type:complete